MDRKVHLMQSRRITTQKKSEIFYRQTTTKKAVWPPVRIMNGVVEINWKCGYLGTSLLKSIIQSPVDLSLAGFRLNNPSTTLASMLKSFLTILYRICSIFFFHLPFHMLDTQWNDDLASRKHQFSFKSWFLLSCSSFIFWWPSEKLKSF